MSDELKGRDNGGKTLVLSCLAVQAVGVLSIIAGSGADLWTLIILATAPVCGIGALRMFRSGNSASRVIAILGAGSVLLIIALLVSWRRSSGY